jgi:hypothetical protein
MKKKWEKPSLQVIVRHKPEEAVLSGCKTNTIVTGAGKAAGGCKVISICSFCLAPGSGS